MIISRWISGILGTLLVSASVARAQSTQVVTHDLQGNFTTQTVVVDVRPPTILAQPANAVGSIGGAVSFGVTVAGSSPFSYQWKLNDTNISVVANPSAATATLRLPSLTPDSFGSYQVVITNAGASVPSASVSLQLDSAGTGIADSWEAQYFGANWATNANAAPGADPDGDGVTNLQEFLDGTNPSDTTSHFYRLKVTGSVAVSPAQTRYAPGTSVTLTATPEGELTFSGWTGDVTSAANPLTLTMNRDYAVTAGTGSPFQLDQPATPPTFTTWGNAIVHAQAFLPDGSVVIGGKFVAVDGVARFDLARINADGTLNTTFQADVRPSAAEAVEALAVQPDGNIIVGGAFGYINGVFSPGLARVSPTGVVDTAFAAKVSAFNSALNSINGVAHPIYAVAVRASDGAILAGGVGTDFTYGYAFSIVLNADGSPNATFNQLASQIGGDYSRVNAVGWEPNGSALIGGTFEQGAATTSTPLARINAAGALDTAFAPSFSGNAEVNSLATFSNGDILVGGDFSQVGGISRSGVARLRSLDGSVDSAVNVGDGVPGAVQCVNVASGDKMLIGGTFDTVNDVDQRALARLNADGSLDTTIPGDANYDDQVLVISAVAATGDILVGGRFDNFNGSANVDLVRLQTATGAVDPAFPAIVCDFYGTLCMTSQPDGKLLVGGVFDYVNTTPRAGFARLNADGTLDTAFLGDGGGTDQAVNHIAVQPDRKILIAGAFSTFDGEPTAVTGYARLNADGTLDTDYFPDPSVSYDVSAMAVQPNGQVLLGGSFTITDPNNPGHPVTSSLIRINLDGTLDPTFNTTLDGMVKAIVVRPDGLPIIAGAFTTADGVSGDAYGVARLYSDGEMDPSFTSPLVASAYADVTTLALQPDGKVLVGGTLYTAIDTYPHPMLRLNPDGSLDNTARLTGYFFPIPFSGPLTAIGVQADGHIVVAGLGLARLNADCTLDDYFPWNGLFTGSNNTPNATAVALPPDGSIVVASTSLLYFNNEARLGYTRFSTPAPNLGPGTLAAAVAGSGVNLTWTPGVAATAITAVSIQCSPDGLNYYPLHAAHPQDDGTWQLSLASLPPSISYFRALATDVTLSQAGSNVVGPFFAAPAVTSYLTVTGTVGVAFGYVATATYPTTGFIVTGLPAWADYYYSSGDGTAYIFGTPDAVGTSTLTLTPSNAAGSRSSLLTLVIGQTYSAWAASYFTQSELGDPAISGPLGDATHAGIVNLIKYALNIPPKQPGVTGLPTLGTITINGLTYLTLTYTATPSAFDVLETVEVSDELDGWGSGPQYTTEISRTPGANGTQTVIVRDNLPMLEEQERFIRLRVSQ